VSIKHQSKGKIKALINEIDNLYNIIRHIPGCVYWKDKEGIYLGCNKIFLDMTGLSSIDEVIGKKDTDLCWKEQASILRAHDLEVIKTRKEKTLEEEVVLGDGSKFTYTVVKAPLKDRNKNIIGIIGTSLDITYRIKHEKQLALAKEKAEAANYAKTEFIANMGHDLTTPFSGIISTADFLHSFYAGKYPELDEFIEEILKSCKALEEVIATILKAVPREEHEEKTTTFSIQDELRHIEDMMTATLRLKNLQLIIHPFEPQNEDLIETDRLKFHLILLSLIGNAVHFTEQGEINVRVLKQDRWFHIEIQDTGIGIPADKFDFIFEPYSKLTRSNKSPAFKGLGQGLYLARLRASQLGGSIQVASELGKGSTFTLSIPAHFNKKSLKTK
jgi:two-component system, OmpR family, aerobic respiration control sensor histidine kinase ArcB